MPSTAEQLVAAARVNFGKAKDERATQLMEAWLDSSCRDWRRETGEGVPDGDTVVSAVFAKPVEAQKLRMQLAQNVKRWGFLRQGHQRGNLSFMTVDKYLEGPTGKLALKRAREIVEGAVQRHAKIVEARKVKRQANLNAVEQRLRSAPVPELRLALKGFWMNAAEGCLRRKADKDWLSSRQDPVAKRRRLTRGLNFEEKDNYTDDGEPIWERVDAARRR